MPAQILLRQPKSRSCVSRALSVKKTRWQATTSYSYSGTTAAILKNYLPAYLQLRRAQVPACSGRSTSPGSLTRSSWCHHTTTRGLKAVIGAQLKLGPSRAQKRHNKLCLEQPAATNMARHASSSEPSRCRFYRRPQMAAALGSFGARSQKRPGMQAGLDPPTAPTAAPGAAFPHWVSKDFCLDKDRSSPARLASVACSCKPCRINKASNAV